MIDWLFDHETDNDYDLFAIKICQDEEFHPQIVGHLPLEMSWFTKFLLDRGATITATLSSTHYRSLPLVQGGLEIPYVVNAKLISTKKIKKSLQSIWKWFKLIKQNRHLRKMLSWVLSRLCLLMKMQPPNRNCCTKCPNKGRKKKSLKNVTIPNLKHSIDIRTFLKEQSIKENKLLQKQKVMYRVTLLNQT